MPGRAAWGTPLEASAVGRGANSCHAVGGRNAQAARTPRGLLKMVRFATAPFEDGHMEFKKKSKA